MALFGRKANQGSSNGDVPPELKPYYVPGSGTVPPRRRALRLVLGLLILAIVATAGVAIWRYVHDHPRPANTLATNQTSQKPKTGTNAPSQGSHPSSTGNNNSSPSTSNQSAPPASSPAPSVTQQLPSDGSNSSTPTPTPAPTGGTGTGPTSQALVNTGPGETVALIAIIAAAGGALLHYLRQVRRANS